MNKWIKPIFGASLYVVFAFFLQFILQNWLLFAVPQVLYWGHGMLAFALAIYIFLTSQQLRFVRLPYSTNAIRVSFNPLIFPFILRIFALSMLIFALAKPQLNTEFWDNVEREGIEIVLALDMSGSMLAVDFKPNRLEAAKEISMQFVLNRKQDKVALVLFEGQAYLQCPLTSDYATLVRLLKEANTGKVQAGTAIGAGLAASLNALRHGTAKSKIVILLTDGVNEGPSQISPELALELAKTLGVRVYTIGVGTNGTAKFPAVDMFGNTVYQDVEVKIDEALLNRISQETGGQYYRATDNEKLKDIYKDIDTLEKDKLKVTQHFKIPEKFYWFLVLALAALLLEMLLKNTLLKTIHYE